MWLIPLSADNVACVNLNTFEIEYYPVPGWESIGKTILMLVDL